VLQIRTDPSSPAVASQVGSGRAWPRRPALIMWST